MTKEELAHLEELESQRASALEALSNHIQTHEQKRNTQREATLEALERQSLTIEEAAARAADALADLHDVHAAQLRKEAALSAAHASTETSHAAVDAVLPKTQEEEQAALLQQAAGARLRGGAQL
jgi:hypothetical protein